MSGSKENVVKCPQDDCDGRFDAVGASFVGTGAACPDCGATWKQLCAATEAPTKPEEVDIEYPVDAPGGVHR